MHEVKFKSIFIIFLLVFFYLFSSVSYAEDKGRCGLYYTAYEMARVKCTAQWKDDPKGPIFYNVERFLYKCLETEVPKQVKMLMSITKE
jgi:hypothetical protein